MKPGFYDGIPNADYHSGPGISKSGLDLLHKSPALLQWSKSAPVDTEAKSAVDLGTMLHTLLLEPAAFAAEYVQAPKFDKRTNAGKAAAAEFEAANDNKVTVDADTWRQLHLMRDSVLAHPTARALLEEEGVSERSFYWNDPATGQLCRCRVDRLNLVRMWGLDVKTTADMDRFAASVADYRYHVQDAFYTDGCGEVLGAPLDAFLFVAVSTSRSAGRYPVRVFSLTPDHKELGRLEYRQDLDAYAECIRTSRWPGIENVALPAWALRDNPLAKVA